MKIVMENLNHFQQHLNFIRNFDPRTSLELGIIPKIKKWLENLGIQNYNINPDGTIDIIGDLNITNKNLENLPDFIKFNKIYGGFFGNGNIWTSLNGFPKIVLGDFELQASWDVRNPKSKIFSKKDILEKVNINGEIYI